MTKTTFARKAALTAALSLSLCGVVGGQAYAAAPALSAAPAFASVTGPAAANPALINPNATAALHIVKSEGVATNLPNNGTQQDPGLPTLAGVTFKITKVAGVDLTTNAGWAAATAYQAQPVTTPPPLDSTVTQTATTLADGIADFADLPVGLYYVQETAAPAGTTMSAPFLVTLPMTDPVTRSTWNYDVYAYPKNMTDTITKTVADKGTQTAEQATQGAGADNTLQYTLTSSITNGLTAAQMGTYVIYDDFDARVQFDGVDSITVGTTQLASTDYTIYVDGAVWDGAPVAGAVVQIVITNLAALAAAPDESVVTVLNGTVLSEAGGSITNDASLIPSNAFWRGVTGDTTASYNPDAGATGGGDTPTLDQTAAGGTTAVTNTVSTLAAAESRFGDALLTKTDAQDGATLEGAVFSVYRAADGATTCTADDVASSVDPLLTGITSGPDGTVLIKGLQVSTFYDGATQTTPLVYCLLETKAPDLYNLNAEPIAFTIDDLASGTPTAVSVQNERSNLANDLPLTGGAGASALGLGGLLLLGSAGALLVAKRRRESAHEDA